MVAFHLIHLDQPSGPSSEEFYVQIQNIYKNRLEYSVHCSIYKAYSMFSLQFLIIDLPEIVEIGYLEYNARFNSSQVFVNNLRKQFPRAPKILISTTYLNSETFLLPNLDTRVSVSARNQSQFNLSIVSDFTSWKGYYLACVDQLPFRCDLELLNLSRNTPVELQYVPLESELTVNDTRKPFDEIGIFYGFQGFRVDMKMSAQIYQFLYRNRKIHFQIDYNNSYFSVQLAYLFIREMECPRGYFFSEFPSFLCKKCSDSECTYCDES